MLHPKNKEELTKIFNKLPSEYTLIQWSASWCGPCRMIKPKIEELSKHIDEKKVKFIYLDTEEFDEQSEKANIRSLPTFQLFKKNELCDTVVGADFTGVVRLLNSKTGVNIDPVLIGLVR